MSTPVINAINNVNDAALRTLFQAVANNATARESLSQSNRNIDAVASNASAADGLGDNAGQDEAIRLCLCRRTGRDPANFPNTVTDILQNETFRGEIFGDATLSQLLSGSQPVMAEIASSAILTNEVIAAQAALQAVVASQTGMQEVAGSQTAMQEVTVSQAAMQEVAASQTAMQEVAASQTAMQRLAGSQTAMQEVAASQTAMQEVGLSSLARSEILSSNTAITELASASTSFSGGGSVRRDRTQRNAPPETDESYPVFISSATYTGNVNTYCYTGVGLYNGDGSFLGKSFTNRFVTGLSLGWNPTSNRCVNRAPLTADIDAVI